MVFVSISWILLHFYAIFSVRRCRRGNGQNLHSLFIIPHKSVFFNRKEQRIQRKTLRICTRSERESCAVSGAWKRESKKAEVIRVAFALCYGYARKQKTTPIPGRASAVPVFDCHTKEDRKPFVLIIRFLVKMV